ncbi:MAG TPA: response regulator [Gemmatimonadaceae bacterium]|nr:response regulator [Gemmatimonadaceae bacterium]
MNAETRTLLIVDDDDVFRDRLVRAMRDRGFEVSGVADHGAAMHAAREASPELALVDLRLPGESGLAIVRDLKALDPSTVVVVLTGYGSIATAVESIKLGAAGYLAKPADADQIMAAFDGTQPAVEGPAVPSLARVEWEHIQRVLADCGGNVSQAARNLGIHRRSLQRKLSKSPGLR